MTEVEDEGLFLIEGDEVTHIHTSSSSETKLDVLEEYLDEWDLEIDQ